MRRADGRLDQPATRSTGRSHGGWAELRSSLRPPGYRERRLMRLRCSGCYRPGARTARADYQPEFCSAAPGSGPCSDSTVSSESLTPWRGSTSRTTRPDAGIPSQGLIVDNDFRSAPPRVAQCRHHCLHCFPLSLGQPNILRPTVAQRDVNRPRDGRPRAPSPFPAFVSP